jgi:prepilin peptidase CpaA
MEAEALLLLALVPVITASAISDLRHLRIPNTHVLVALAVFALLAPLVLSWAQLTPRLLTAAVTFLICLALFVPGLIGGGDVKMLPAVMLFVPGQDIVLFLQIFSIALGAISLGALAFQRIAFFRRLGWESAVAPRHVPVGLAMAVAVIGLAGVRLLAP